MLTSEELIIILSFVACVTCKIYHYGIDNENFCHSQSEIAKWLDNDDAIRIYGKMTVEHKFTECVLKLGPSSKATKLVTKIQFEMYNNKDCSIYLAVTESPHTFFEKDVSTLFNLSCGSNPVHREYYTSPSNNIRIVLHKSYSHLWNYNFIFNVSLSDHTTESGMSTTIIIGIGILVAIAIPGIGCVVFRYLKIHSWSKRQFQRYDRGDDADDETSSRSPLSAARAHSRLPAPSRYSGLPGERSTQVSQTCVIVEMLMRRLVTSRLIWICIVCNHCHYRAARGSDGRCTVCHRIHDDFAHFVEVEAITDTHGSSDTGGSNCHLCHRSHDDFAHLVEIDGVTHVANSPEHHRHLHRHVNTTQSNGQNASPAAVTVLSPPVEDETSSDDDIDLSGNDLIPPSYNNDLSPPSYEEAVTMPQPQEVGHRQITDAEVNPLYQNLNSLTTES